MGRNQQTLDKIKEIYSEQRYTKSQFAELIGKSNSAWARREQEEVPLTLDETEFIAEKLGTNFGTLTNSSNSIVVNNKGLIANSGSHATISIQLTPDQLIKVMDILKEEV